MKMSNVLADLQKVKRANEEFSKKYDMKFMEMLEKEETAPEAYLTKEILTELVEKMIRVDYIIRYLGFKEKKEGVLSRDCMGNILFDGQILMPMHEFEILVYNPEVGHDVWTRTCVSLALGGMPTYLLGINKGTDINGLKARIRYQDKREDTRHCWKG